MDFRLLGPVEVRQGMDPLSLGGPKPRTLLAHLLLELNQVVPAERLIEAVWDEQPPKAARNTLQTYVSHLRRELGPDRLEGRAGGYVLHGEGSEVDVYRFEQLLAAARAVATDDPAGAVRTYREALAQWRGPALDDLADQPSLRAEIVRLEELRLTAVEERLRKELELGRHAEVVAELERLTGRYPLRERLWAHLMVALYRSGRQADALAAYQRARDTLADELGIDPSPELQRLQEQVLRQDLALEVAGTPLRGYRLLEQLGAGVFGVVHRGFHPQMGREVAIKVIHARLANDAEFIRRFETEAQLVARLEHPHLVPLYDYWREPDGAYLVMRYLRGGSLREALADGPLDSDTAVGVLEHVGTALDAAHGHGVVHRDIKPENILLDEAGNAYLSDFGIAKDLAQIEGSPGARTPSDLAAYRSPEEVLGEQPTAQTDIYSLGLVVYELLAGRHPYATVPPERLEEAQLREPVPPLRVAGTQAPGAVEEVLVRATAKDPSDRYQTASELVGALRTALADGPQPATPVLGMPLRNPYKGLRAFHEADAGDFHGREELVDRLVARLADDDGRFLAIVGPSGSGKSSLVRAGLVPALRRGAVAGSERWFVVDMLPGTDPFAEFQAALLRVAARPLPPNLIDQLGQDPRGLVRAAAWVLPADGSELLLVIDQLEELFTGVQSDASRQAFVDSLVAAVSDPANQVRVVSTLRGDFYDRPLRYPGLAELVRAHTEVVVPLTTEQLERAVTVPARQVGVDVEQGFLAQLAADVADQPGSLPLVQYTLTELFDQREGAALTLAAYRELGGVSGALARRAEEVLASLGAGATDAARQLFLRLVTLGEGVEDTRRRVTRAELDSLPTDTVRMDAAIEAFGRARLLLFDRDPATREPTVEVAHEALLREWVRLRGWVDAAREDLRTQRRLAAAARDWHDADRDVSFLASGSRLDQFGALAEQGDVALSPDERAFLDASLAERDRRASEEEARRERERALERRSLRRLRALVAVFAAAAVIAGGLTVAALGLANQRAEQVRITTARELAAAAVANLDVDPERSILLALEAVAATRADDGTVLREAEEALRHAVKTFRGLYTVQHGHLGVAVDPDGVRFATTGPDGDVSIRDLDTGAEQRRLEGHDGSVHGVAFAPDGTLLATAGDDGTARVWDADSGEQVLNLTAHESTVDGVAFSPDGARLATSDWDGTVHLWDAHTGELEATLTGHTGRVSGLAFTPDGARLVTGGIDTTIRLWDLASGESEPAVEAHNWGVMGLAVSPDGAQLASASVDARVRTWDLATGEHLQTFFTDGVLFDVDASADGSRLAAVGSDGRANVWDAESGERLLTLPGHVGIVTGVAFTPDGDGLLTTGFDNTTRLWDIRVEGSRDWLTVAGPPLRWADVTFSPDGTRFAVPADPTGVRLHDTETGAVVRTLEGHDATIVRMAFSPDGSLLAGVAGGAGGDHDANTTVPVWDVATGELLLSLTGHDAPLSRGVAFDPGGDRLVTSGFDGTVRLWDLTTGAEEARADLDVPAIFGATFSPDGRYVVTGDSAGDAIVWDAATLEPVRTIATHGMEINEVVVSSEGWFATGDDDGTAGIWDLETGEELQTLRGHTGVIHGIAVSADGSRIATASHDGTARIWDPETGREVLTLPGDDPLFGVAFSADGRFLATSSPMGIVAVHLLPLEDFLAVARERVTRDLTDDECRQYLHVEQCPER